MADFCVGWRCDASSGSTRRQVGEPFLLHTSPIQPRATLDRDLGWEGLTPRPGRFIQALGKGRKQQAGRGFRLRALDVQPRSCPFAGLVEVHADGRVRGAGARAAYHHRQTRRGGEKGSSSSSSSEPRLIDSSPDSEYRPLLRQALPAASLDSVGLGQLQRLESSVRSTSDPQLVPGGPVSPREPPASSGSGGLVTPLRDLTRRASPLCSVGVCRFYGKNARNARR